MTVIVVFLLVIVGISGWWLAQHRLMSKPWLEQGLPEGLPGATPSTLPTAKVGLGVFLAVVGALFALFASAYFMRMELADWQAPPVPVLLWFNTGVLVLASVALHFAVVAARRGEDDVVRLALVTAGVTTIVFVPTIDDVTAPEWAEINAGIDLTMEVIAAAGWQISTANVTYNPLGTRFTPSIPGRDTVEDSSLTLPQDMEGDDIRMVLPRGTNGYIVIAHGGLVAGRPMDVWPVRVSSQGRPVTTEGTEIASIQVNMAIPAEPAENVAVPAAAS
jgi:hypothetical protein